MRAPAELLPVLVRLADVLKRLNRAEEEKAAAASQGHHQLLDPILTEEQALILELRGAGAAQALCFKGSRSGTGYGQSASGAGGQRGKGTPFPCF